MLLLAFMSGSILSGLAETNLARISPFLKASPAYQDAVFKLMLYEANIYADQLNLPEKLPLTQEFVKEKFIASPHLASYFGPWVAFAQRITPTALARENTFLTSHAFQKINRAGHCMTG